MLAGRDRQLAAIRAALTDIGGAGTSLLLRGDPGTGKTTLLKEAGAAAVGAGLRVLRMTGAAAESGLPYAALHQVLWPLLDDTPALPAGQRDALETALGVRDGPLPRAGTVADAALALLAPHGPIVVLQDDLQWADPASRTVFGHLRRRAGALPVVIIGATREPAPDDRAMELPPLTEEESERLLRALHPWLPEGARHRVRKVAAGNPLACTNSRRASARRPPTTPPTSPDPAPTSSTNSPSANGSDGSTRTNCAPSRRRPGACCWRRHSAARTPNGRTSYGTWRAGTPVPPGHASWRRPAISCASTRSRTGWSSGIR
ncbi:ATP-binding protein [Streptomyces sp. NPDC002784]